MLGSAPYCLAVVTVDDDALAGWVDWRETERPAPGSWEIGVLIVPEMRGRGAGAAAQRLLVDYLFSTTTVIRIWATTEAGNVAEQRALERSRFRQEGRLRGTNFRDGQWRDSFIYGIVRDDISRSATGATGGHWGYWGHCRVGSTTWDVTVCPIRQTVVPSSALLSNV